MSVPTECFGNETPFVRFTSVERTTDKNGNPRKVLKPLKRFTGSKDWTRADVLEKQEKFKHGGYASFYLRFGNLAVIDWDDKHNEPPQAIWDWVEAKQVPWTTSLSGQGFHFWVKPSDKPALIEFIGDDETKCSALADLDVLMVKKQVWEINKVMVANWRGEVPTIDNADLIQTWQLLDKQTRKKRKENKTKPDEKANTNSAEVPLESIPLPPPPPPTPTNDFNETARLARLLDPAKRLTEYEDWRDVGFCLYNIGKGDTKHLELFLEISKQVPAKYDENYARRFWDSIQFHSNSGLQMGSLVYWAREDAPQVFTNPLDDVIGNTSNKQVADYLMAHDLKHLTGKIVFTGSAYYVCNAFNVWEFHETTPYALLEGIDALIKDLEAYLKQKLEEYKQLEKGKNELRKFITAIKNTIKTLGAITFRKNTVLAIVEPYTITRFESKLDKNPNVLAFTDKLVDLDTMEVRDIQPEDYIGHTTGYAYPAGKDLTRARARVQEIFNSIFSTPAVARYVLNILARSLSGYNKEEKFYILKGSGRNGKGVMMTLFERALGAYCVSLNIELFTKQKHNSLSANPELHHSQHARACNTTEPEFGSTFQRSNLKKLTGGDKQKTRTLYSKAVEEWIPFFTLFIQSNEDVLFSGGIDRAILERLVVITFPYTFVERVKDPEVERPINMNLKREILEDDDLRDAMILTLLDNLKTETETITPPQEIINENDTVLNDNNPVKVWLEGDACEYKKTADSKSVVSTRELYEAYTNDLKVVISEKAFISHMICLGYYKKRETRPKHELFTKMVFTGLVKSSTD